MTGNSFSTIGAGLETLISQA